MWPSKGASGCGAVSADSLPLKVDTHITLREHLQSLGVSIIPECSGNVHGGCDILAAVEKVICMDCCG